MLEISAGRDPSQSRFLSDETVAVTELEPAPRNGRRVFIGKMIRSDGSISDYPKAYWWKQTVSEVPANI